MSLVEEMMEMIQFLEVMNMMETIHQSGQAAEVMRMMQAMLADAACRATSSGSGGSRGSGMPAELALQPTLPSTPMNEMSLSMMNSNMAESTVIDSSDSSFMEAALMNSTPLRPGMKPGDWICAFCGDHQFAKNTQCRQCGAPNVMGPVGGKGPNHFAPIPPRTGDWNCPSCGDLQFMRNAVCKKCGADKPDGAAQAKLPGDWICPGCGDLQYAKNNVCRLCSIPNPDPEGSKQERSTRQGTGFEGKGGMQMRMGPWHCGNCGDAQHEYNTECGRCGAPRAEPLPQGDERGMAKGGANGKGLRYSPF